MVGLIGLIIGALMKVLIPYLRLGLEDVAKTGSLKAWPKFDYRYGAMALLPLLGYGVAFLTLPGVWDATLTWQFIPAVALGYSGADLGKEAFKLMSSAYSLVKR